MCARAARELLGGMEENRIALLSVGTLEDGESVGGEAMRATRSASTLDPTLPEAKPGWGQQPDAWQTTRGRVAV